MKTTGDFGLRKAFLQIFTNNFRLGIQPVGRGSSSFWTAQPDALGFLSPKCLGGTLRNELALNLGRNAKSESQNLGFNIFS